MIILGLILCAIIRPDMKKLLLVFLILGAASEIIKVVSVMRIVPVVDPVIIEEGGKAALSYIPRGEYTPIMGAEHLPFELCSLQLFFAAACYFLKNEKARHFLYALMYPTGVIGGLLGIVMASITAYYNTPAEYFSSARVWQFFIYHSMVVLLSIYIGFSKECGLRLREYKNAVIGLIALDVPTFYLNSVLSSEIYVNDKLVGVTHRINFFSSYVNPLGLPLTETWQWLVYLAIRAAIALLSVLLFFLPLAGRKIKQGDAE